MHNCLDPGPHWSVTGERDILTLLQLSLEKKALGSKETTIATK